MRHQTCTVLLLTCTVLLRLTGAACGAGAEQGAPNLTRARAKAVIDQDARFRRVENLPLVAPLEAGVKEGLWRQEPSLVLTEEGRRFFAAVNWNSFFQVGGIVPAPSQSVTREIVEITGIMSGQDLRQVQFQWRYKGLSDVLLRYTGEDATPRKGAATLQLYDDGWRLQEVRGLIDTKPLAPFRYDEAKLRLWEEAEARRAEAEARRAEAERAAKTPTRTIASYTFNTPKVVGPRPRVYKLTITDTNLTLISTYGDVTSPHSDKMMFYGDCEYPTLTPPSPERSVGSVPGWQISLSCSFTEAIPSPGLAAGRKTQGKVWITTEDPALKQAYDQIVEAYEAWRAKHPKLVTK